MFGWGRWERGWYGSVIQGVLQAPKSQIREQAERRERWSCFSQQSDGRLPASKPRGRLSQGSVCRGPVCRTRLLSSQPSIQQNLKLSLATGRSRSEGILYSVLNYSSGGERRQTPLPVPSLLGRERLWASSPTCPVPRKSKALSLRLPAQATCTGDGAKALGSPAPGSGDQVPIGALLSTLCILGKAMRCLESGEWNAALVGDLEDPSWYLSL